LIEHYRTVALVLQRTILILTLLAIPIIILWNVIEPVFRLLGQDEDVSAGAALYVRFDTTHLPWVFFACVLFRKSSHIG
jgi:Na+-driven multidrug efflux pump